MAQTRHIDVHWDAEARVWWAESHEIPGFVTEAPTYAALVERAGHAAAELLRANEQGAGPVELLFRMDHPIAVETD